MKYTVKPGDSLSIIARDVLGDMELWRGIAFRNKITGPDFSVWPGQVLELPDVKTAAVADPVRMVKPGLTITAPVPLSPSGIRMLPEWVLWLGALAGAVYFMFPPKKSGGMRRRVRVRRRRYA